MTILFDSSIGYKDQVAELEEALRAARAWIKLQTVYDDGTPIFKVIDKALGDE